MQSDMLVKEIMTREVCKSEKDKSVLNASRKMIRFGVGSILVMEDQQVIGIVTERDIVNKLIGENNIPHKIKVQDIMSSPLTTITPNTSVREASDTMQKKNIRRLPVLENGHLVGIITDVDILKVSTELNEALDYLTSKKI